MAQKAHPNSLRITPSIFQGCAYWNEAQFNYITYSIYKLIRTCCQKTDIYADKIKIGMYHDYLFIKINVIHVHSKSKRRGKSRRKKENTRSYIRKHTQKTWKTVLRRFYFAMKMIQQFTGLKTIQFRIKRLKTYTRAIPKTARAAMSYYNKSFNRIKYNYARSGMQLMNLVLQSKTNALSLAIFIRENIRSRSRRRKHADFLRFLKQGFNSLKKNYKVKGLKIRIKGRFGPKPKGRSRIWKYQIGKMPFSKLDIPIQAEYMQAQTILGSVGIKVWICYD